MKHLNSGRQRNFNLTLSDFKTETKKSVIKSVWISPELPELLPKQPTEINGETSIVIKLSKTTVQIFQKAVEISFDPGDIQGDLERFVNKINEQLDWLSFNKIKVEEIIIRDLLELKNSTWLEEQEERLNKESFINRIELDSIYFFDDTSFEVRFVDGGIFAGHTIVVSVDKGRRVEGAIIEG